MIGILHSAFRPTFEEKDDITQSVHEQIIILILHLLVLLR